MISHLSIRGLGPCADLDIDLDPVGITTITGPSMVGKSTLIRASTWALLGVDIDGNALDVRAIDDTKEGEQFVVTRAEVALTTKTGTVINRTITRSRSQGRKITKGGQTQDFVNEEQFAAALGKTASTIPVLQSQEHAARLVMVPFGWVSLTHKGGRALRDLLGQLVPGDHRAEVAKLMAPLTLGADDPVDEKGAVALRKTANAERDTADGALREAKAAFEGLVEPAAPASTNGPHAILEVAKAWTDFETLSTTYETAIAARDIRAADRAKARDDREVAHAAEVARAADAQRDWDRRKAALGDTPKHPVAPPQSKDRDALDKLNTRIAVLTTTTAVTGAAAAKAANLTREHSAAVLELMDLEGHGDTCPKCKRAGWSEKQAEIGRLSEKVTGLQEELNAALQELDAEKAAAETKRTTELADAEGEREKLRARIADQDAAKARYDADLSAWNAFDAARKALGDRPGVPVPLTSYDDHDGEPGGMDAEPALVEPVMPPFQRPTADEIATAKATIDTATKAAGARDEYDRARKNAAMRVDKARAELESKAARADHLDRLVDAVRRAPIERAKKQAEVLGDLGPVSFEVTPEGAEVLFDGRPEFLASHGRRIVCDLWLRAGLRRAVGMPWLPIWVDDSASWTGDWPAIPGPLVFLVTAPGELVVEHERVAA